MRPSTFILGSDNRKRWSTMDVLIMQAYQIIQDEACSQHGGPRWMCRHDDPRLQVKMVKDDCYAQQELDIYRDEHKDDKHTPPVYPEFYTTDGSPLSDYRESYYAQKRAEREAEQEDD